MCTPSFMCKFPFSGREFVAGRRRACLRLAAHPAAWREQPPAAHSLCETAAATSQPRRAPASRDRLPAGGARAKRCSTGCTRTSASSSAPTSTARAACARCWPHTAAADARTSSRSRARGIASRAPAARPGRRPRASCAILDHAARGEPDERDRPRARSRDRGAPRAVQPSCAQPSPTRRLPEIARPIPPARSVREAPARARRRGASSARGARSSL